MRLKITKIVIAIVIVIAVVMVAFRNMNPEVPSPISKVPSLITNSRVLAEIESLHVFGTDEFPEDLQTEIRFGDNIHPYFSTAGKRGRLEFASINMHRNVPSVAMVRKDTEGESYVLYLFMDDEIEEVIKLYDLNIDGEWDVKITPTLEKMESIRVDNEWLNVVNLDNFLKNNTPTASNGEILYRFDGKKWGKAK